MCLGGNGMLPNNSSAASVVREFCGWICFEERNSKGMLWHSVKGDGDCGFSLTQLKKKKHLQHWGESDAQPEGQNLMWERSSECIWKGVASSSELWLNYTRCWARAKCEFWFVEATRFSFEFKARRRSNPELPQLELGLEWQFNDRKCGFGGG